VGCLLKQARPQFHVEERKGRAGSHAKQQRTQLHGQVQGNGNGQPPRQRFTARRRLRSQRAAALHALIQKTRMPLFLLRFQPTCLPI